MNKTEIHFKQVEIVLKANKAVVVIFKTQNALVAPLLAAAILARAGYETALLEDPSMDPDKFLEYFRKEVFKK